MTVQVKVSFPHKDWQGNAHDVGEVYSCSEQEAQTRVTDGFVRRVESRKPAEPKAPAK
ncbi:hypothetical protein AB0I87_13555 [Streptomyces sp. NPDC049952]|uniref:hypothetical protein n=1 Tax=Streptomyces sp. NPDC049952 TaxID=3156665 RepID=UPI00341686A6